MIKREEMYARDTEYQEVFMEDLDVNDCSDDTLLPDFGGQLQDMATSGDKRKLPTTVFEEDGFNDRLKRAARKSESEGSLTPMVKEELRCFIAAKRHSEGKQEIKVEFKAPEQYPLTRDELIKKERRREQNRRAATKCRRKKKSAKEEKESEMKKLKNQNEDLAQMVQELQGQVKRLATVLRDHGLSGQCALQPKTETTSFMQNIPTHLFEESDTPEIDSPQCSRSFFSSSVEISQNSAAASCSGYHNTCYSNQRLSTEINDCSGFPLNNTMEMTPPHSPYITEFPENISSVIDPQLSDILRELGSDDI